MNKKERKEFRTLLYERYGSKYMEDKASVEALYDAPFAWVMKETRAGSHPTLTLTQWKKQFNETQAICVELLGNTVALSAWNDMVASLAVHNKPERLRLCFKAGMTPEIANNYIEQQVSDGSFDAAIKHYSWSREVSRRSEALRGEPFGVIIWKREREEVLCKRKRAISKNPQLEYELHRLNWLIGDMQPKGGQRVLRLKIINLAHYPSYASFLELRQKIQNFIKSNRATIEAVLRPGGYGRLWIDALQEWRNPYDVIQEIERVIRHVGGVGLDYTDFAEDMLNKVCYSLNIPRDILDEPLPQAAPTIKGSSRRPYEPFPIGKIDFEHIAHEGNKNGATTTILGLKRCPYCKTNTRFTNDRCNECGNLWATDRKEWPGGYISIGSADNPKPLRGGIGLGFIYDQIDELTHGDFHSALIRDRLKKQFTDKSLGETVNDAITPDLTVEVTREPFAFKIEVTDNFSHQLNKIKTVMQNQTNGSSTEMSKEQKRARIKELENNIAGIQQHRKNIEDVQKAAKNATGQNVRLSFCAASETATSPYAYTLLYNPDFMKTSTFIKLYLNELDEDEKALTEELNKLIS